MKALKLLNPITAIESAFVITVLGIVRMIGNGDGLWSHRGERGRRKR